METIGGGALPGVIEKESRLLLVYFWQAGCEPCRELRPQLERLLTAQPDLCRGVSLDVDREPGAALQHGVRRTPTVAFFKGGRELHRFHGGALPESVRRMIE